MGIHVNTTNVTETSDVSASRGEAGEPRRRQEVLDHGRGGGGGAHG